MPKTAKPLDLGLLKSRVLYEPDTGLLFSVATEKPIGRTDRQGYVSIDIPSGVKGRRSTVLAHRIAYGLMTGSDVPKGMFVDHINQFKDDNRWSNLRLVSHRQNMINSVQPRTVNDLPYGVRPNPRSSTKPFKVSIQVWGKTRYLGSFRTIEEASAVAIEARERAWNEPAS